MLARIVPVDPGDDRLAQQCSTVLTTVGKVIYDPSFTQYMARHGVMWAALDETNEAVGVLATDTWGPWDTREWNRRLAPDRVLSSDPPGLHLLDMAVHEDQRHRGLATRLIRKAMNAVFYDDGGHFNRVLAVSRVPVGGGTDTSLGLLLRLGFIELAYAANYYGTVEPGVWRCPDCPSHGPCRCSGHLMLWQRR
jgi:ribosomal protein S18 acetylase RimI-like enzyme